MKKAFRFTILTATCLTVAFLAFSQSKDDSLDVLKVCADTQKLIFENRFVRVIDDQVPAGAAEPLHSHPHGVLIYLADCKNEIVTQDGKKSVSELKAGTAIWVEATVHTVKNIGKTPGHAIRIDVKY